MTKDEALKLAQRALSNKNASTKSIYEALAAISAALVQPEQEQGESLELFEYWNAVEGWVKIEEVRKHFGSVGCGTIYKTSGEDRVPLYTTPPQRTWVGLTDDETRGCIEATIEITDFLLLDAVNAVIVDVERLLREKNNG